MIRGAKFRFSTSWHLKQELLNTIDEATAAEFAPFERFSETDRVVSYLEELKNVAERATARFSQFSSIQLRIADAQPFAAPDMLELVNKLIINAQQRLPAWKRSIREVKTEWRL